MTSWTSLFRSVSMSGAILWVMPAVRLSSTRSSNVAAPSHRGRDAVSTSRDRQKRTWCRCFGLSPTGCSKAASSLRSQRYRSLTGACG